MEIWNKDRMSRQTDIVGRVTNVISEMTPDGGVFVVKAISMNQDFTVVCNFFCPIHEGDSFYGVVVPERHPKYGQVLMVQRPPFVQLPVKRDELEDCFRRVLTRTGFGAVKAAKLFDAFQDATHGSETVVNHITTLAKCWIDSQDDDLFMAYNNIINNEQMKKLLGWWHKNRTLRRLYLLGLTDREIESCHLPADIIYTKCITNPYVLPGIELKKCEEILFRQNKQGKPEDIRCGEIVRKMHLMMKSAAHSGIDLDVLLGMFPDLPKLLLHLKTTFEVKIEFRMAYLPFPYLVEIAVAKRVVAMIGHNLKPGVELDSEERESVTIQEKLLGPEQQAAIQGAIDNEICVITGIGGTGKTTVIKAICHDNSLTGKTTRVAAFTGKAVAQCRRATQSREATTINQLIAKAKIIGHFDHLILDESSMITSALMYRLFLAFPFRFKLTLIGDINQLPPIEWGTFFDQVITSGHVPVFRLTKIHRINSDDHGILTNSLGLVNLIQNGVDEYDPFEFVETPNFQFRYGDVNEVYSIVRDLHQEGVTQEQVTIVSPFNADLVDLNCTVQQIFNENEPQVTGADNRIWSPKDRVMLLENDYNINVFNGEEGIVQDVTKKEIAVMFQDGVTHYFSLEARPDQKKRKTWREKRMEKQKEPENELFADVLTHSWAVTVHKSQGSEWPYVIVYIPKDQGAGMIRQKLIYTAMSRAKKRVWIVGDVDAFKKAAGRKESARYENLATRIQHLIEPPEEEKQEVAVIRTPKKIRIVGLPTPSPSI